MEDAVRIWREKSDDELIEAAAELDQFTDAGKAIIRAELKRRHLEDPLEQAARQDSDVGDAEPELECLRCRATLRPVETDDDDEKVEWTLVPRGSHFDTNVPLYAYVCPRCGHVELFMDIPEGDQPSE